MPRQARLDAPGTLHHVMVRGIEKRRIVDDGKDRGIFISRLGEAAASTGMAIYAWALLPNHAHILLRSGPQGLPVFMRRFLTGYAIEYNRRHRRHGHLFQNRYKSIVCEEDAYFRELVRYLHLNPLRAGVVPDLRALDRYPWTGHSALLGTRPCPWQAAGAILQQFGPTPARARKAYRAFVTDGIPLGHRPDLQGGGLIRSLGGWRAVASLRRGREAYLGDERILGGAEFVEQCRREAAHAHPPPARRPAVVTLLSRVCAATGCAPPALHHGSRRATTARAREGLAYLVLEVYGYPGSAVADLLGVRPPGGLPGRAARARQPWTVGSAAQSG